MDSQQCQVCGEVFLNLNFVILHLNAHSRKEIYECLVSLKSSLEIFMKQYFALKDFINGNVMQEKNKTDKHDKHSSQVQTTPHQANRSGIRKNGFSSNANEPQINYHHHGHDLSALNNSNSEKRKCFETEAGRSPRRRHTKSNEQPSEDFVDLTDIEIKTENVETDVSVAMENAHCNNFHSPSMGSNSDSALKGDNLDCNSGNVNVHNNLNDIPINQCTDNAGPVAIIDLSRTIQENGRCQEPESFDICLNNKNLVHSNQNTHSEKYIQNSMYITMDNGPNKRDSLGPTKINSNRQYEGESNITQIFGNEDENSSQIFSGTTCLVCGKSFATKFVLRRHMMSHTGERTHNCPICGKGFIGKQNMMVHIRVHTGERPYKCLHCGQQFSQYGTLYRHKKRHMASGDIRNAGFSKF